MYPDGKAIFVGSRHLFFDDTVIFDRLSCPEEASDVLPAAIRRLGGFVNNTKFSLSERKK
jgi:hypothetical protein